MRALPVMPQDAIDKTRRLQDAMQQMPQVAIDTQHLIHAGMYARTVLAPAGCVVVGAHITLATILIMSGHATVYIGDEAHELRGYHVIAGEPGRKQAVLAHSDTHFTMLFPSAAQSVADAENEFTDEADGLLSRLQPDHSLTVITGDNRCLE